MLSTVVETKPQTMENGGFPVVFLWKTLWIVWIDFVLSPLVT